jgi:esterase/lipase superfamily enzyme
MFSRSALLILFMLTYQLLSLSSAFAATTGVSPTGGATGGNIQEVFFATDRNKEKSKQFKIDSERVTILKELGEYIPEANRGKVELLQQFGNTSAGISYGRCLVTIPENHRIGEVERPFLDFVENLSVHIGIIKAETKSLVDFFSTMNGGFEKNKKRAFIFVHGHNVPFDDAARRTAQIAQDLAFEGAPIFYSWPSKPCWIQMFGCGYSRNEAMVEDDTTRAQFVGFLTDFFKNSDADSVYIIAHSLGTRLVTKAVNEWSDTVEPKERSRLKEVILAASDLSAEVFQADIMPKLSKAKMPVTLYAAKNDLALFLSENFKHDDEPRLGQAKLDIALPDNITLIDATNINVAKIGTRHSYAAGKRPVISDIYYLIGRSGSEKVNTPFRFGITRQTGRQGYWEFDK